jgi:integrase/recombinase XerC
MAGSRSEATRRAYAADLRLFFAFRGVDVSPAAVGALCELSTAEMAMALSAYAESLRGPQNGTDGSNGTDTTIPRTGKGLSPATINRRLAAIRSLLRIARRFGLTSVDVGGLVDSEKARKYKDTRGPTLVEVAAVMAAVDRSTLAGKRDYAVLRLMWENALRRGSISAANIEDYDSKARKLSIITKGHARDPRTITLTKSCTVSIDAYLEARTGGGVLLADGTRSAGRRLANGEPLFANLKNGTGEAQDVEARRLRGDGLYYTLRRYGAQALERKLSPHMMRHSSATAYLDASGGDTRGAQALTGHVDPRTLQIYDDNRKDLQGAASEAISKLA